MLTFVDSREAVRRRPFFEFQHPRLKAFRTPTRLPASGLAMTGQCIPIWAHGTVEARNGSAVATTIRLVALFKYSHFLSCEVSALDRSMVPDQIGAATAGALNFVPDAL